jgi:hypothetical protein
MKNKKIEILLTATTILFLLSGCGGSTANHENDITTLNEEEPTDSTDNSDIVLEFKTEGAYDLSNYLFPKRFTQKQFRVKTYTDDTDLTDTVYGTVASTTFYTQTIKENNNQITFKKDDQIDIQYTLLDDRIQIENSTVSNPVDIVRFTDIGDYIGSIDKNITTNFNIQCKLNEHLESKNNFPDVLSVVCQSQNGLYQGKYFFAKDIGSILEVNSLCTQNRSNDLNCTNIVTDFITPN